MDTISLIGQQQGVERKRIRSNRKAVCSALAFVCFGSGFFSPLIGLVFIIIHTAIPRDVHFGQFGTVFMIVSIPLLLLGSHLMDVFERQK